MSATCVPFTKWHFTLTHFSAISCRCLFRRKCPCYVLCIRVDILNRISSEKRSEHKLIFSRNFVSAFDRSFQCYENKANENIIDVKIDLSDTPCFAFQFLERTLKGSRRSDCEQNRAVRIRPQHAKRTFESVAATCFPISARELFRWEKERGPLLQLIFRRSRQRWKLSLLPFDSLKCMFKA